MKIKVIEILKVKANPWDLTDQDKIIADVLLEDKEYKIVLPDQEIESELEFVSFLANVIQKINKQSEQPKVINLSEKWQGEYEVDNDS